MTALVMERENVIDVATGEVKAAKAPACLECLALGSCVAVILYDKESKIGGIAHVMLPVSPYVITQRKERLKYADVAVPELIQYLQKLGAKKESLCARMVGGALMIPGVSDIGRENSEAARKILHERNIKILDEHLGGTEGRSVTFDLSTGELRINGKREMEC